MQKIIATIAALLAALFASVSVFSQTEKTALKRKSESKLLVAQTKGVVVDRESGQPIPYAGIYTKTGETVLGAMSNEAGQFTIYFQYEIL